MKDTNATVFVSFINTEFTIIIPKQNIESENKLILQLPHFYIPLGKAAVSLISHFNMTFDDINMIINLACLTS